MFKKILCTCLVIITVFNFCIVTNAFDEGNAINVNSNPFCNISLGDCINNANKELLYALSNLPESERMKVKKVRFMEGVRYIVTSYLKYFPRIEEIYIPESVEQIQLYDDVSKLSGQICNESFKDFIYLKKINIPSKITEIKSSAFEGCLSLEEPIISDRVCKINKYAFSRCNSLKNINLPQDLTTLSPLAFYRSENLKNINITGNKLKNVAYLRNNRFINRNTKLTIFKDKNLVKRLSGLYTTSQIYYLPKKNQLGKNILIPDTYYKPRYKDENNSYHTLKQKSIAGESVKNIINQSQYYNMNQMLFPNCYLVASISSILHTHPEWLSSCIKDEDDKTVTIRLFETSPDGSVKEVTYKVSKNLLLSEDNKDGTTNEQKLLNIFEKVFAVHLNPTDISQIDMYKVLGLKNNSTSIYDVLNAITGDMKYTDFPLLNRYYNNIKEAKTNNIFGYFSKQLNDFLLSQFSSREEYNRFINTFYKISSTIEEDGSISLTPVLRDLDDIKKDIDKLDITMNKDRRNLIYLMIINEAESNNDLFYTPFSGNYCFRDLVTAKKIDNALRSKVPCICATYSKVIGNDDNNLDEQKDGLIGAHAYSIHGLTELIVNGKRGIYIKLRNVWGFYVRRYKIFKGNVLMDPENEHKSNGIMYIELNDFINNFCFIITNKDMYKISDKETISLLNTLINKDPNNIAFREYFMYNKYAFYAVKPYKDEAVKKQISKLIVRLCIANRLNPDKKTALQACTENKLLHYYKMDPKYIESCNYVFIYTISDVIDKSLFPELYRDRNPENETEISNQLTICNTPIDSSEEYIDIYCNKSNSNREPMTPFNINNSEVSKKINIEKSTDSSYDTSENENNGDYLNMHIFNFNNMENNSSNCSTSKKTELQDLTPCFAPTEMPSKEMLPNSGEANDMSSQTESNCSEFIKCN